MHIRRFGLSVARSSLPVRRNSSVPHCLGRFIVRGEADGAARMGATLFSELLNAVFANVGQRAVRTVARQTFGHLLNLDLKFHLTRQTGGLTRAIDRGTK
jgi:ATP-binding cassette subfamily B (MDR/TAP) protein 7